MKKFSPRQNAIYILQNRNKSVDELVEDIYNRHEFEIEMSEQVRLEIKINVKRILNLCAKCTGKACSTPTMFWLKEFSNMVYVKYWFCKTGLSQTNEKILKRIAQNELHFNKVAY